MWRAFNESTDDAAELRCPGATSQAAASRAAAELPGVGAGAGAGGAGSPPQLFCSHSWLSQSDTGQLPGLNATSAGGLAYSGLLPASLAGTCQRFDAAACGQPLGPCWGEAAQLDGGGGACGDVPHREGAPWKCPAE